MMTIMAATISFSAMAQENEQRSQKIDQTEMIQRRTDMMVQRYGLNDDQKAKLLELNKEFADKMPMMGFRNGGPRGMGGGPRGNMGGQRRQGPPPAMNNGENGQNQRQGRPESPMPQEIRRYLRPNGDSDTARTFGTFRRLSGGARARQALASPATYPEPEKGAY